MKTIILALALFSTVSPLLRAQPAPQGEASSTNVTVSPASASYAIVSRDANSRMWASISTQTNAAGEVVSVTNAAYTELASGLCRWSGTGWVDASETIVITNDGAQTTNARHYVHFMGNANTAGGAVRLVTPDQLDFYSRVYGLAYADSALDTNILVAPLQDAQGVVVGDHTVIYSNVFSGPITADLEYENKLGGLEQNVILRTQLPTPASVGLNNNSTAVQIWTEFFDPPMPQQLTVTNNGNTDTAILDWGAMAMGVGKAFSLQAQGQDSAPDLGRVKKHWVQLNGRTFLVEEVPWAMVAQGTQNLPLHASASSPGAAIKNLASLRPIPPKNAASTLPSGPMLAAKEGPSEPGLVLDYSIMGSTGSNYVFHGDTTYYISGGVTLSGTNNIIEGGAVIKYTNSGFLYVYNVHTAALISQASPYRMAVFTSKNDNSVGDTIAGSTGSPSTGTGTYLSMMVMSAPSTLAYLRFRYAGTALTQTLLSYVNVNAVWDSQFVQCTTAIAIGGAGCGCETTYESLYNVLMANCVNGVVNTTWAYGDGLGVVGQNVTADQVTQFLSTWSGDPSYWSSSQLYNCMLTSVPNMVLFLDNDANYDMPYSSTVWSLTAGSYYQTVGGGAYYLTNGSPYRNAGTTNINATLLASLKLKTTYPPTVCSNAALGTNLAMTASRETNALPDLGYAYDPLDYALFNVGVTNATVTVQPGTALAVCGSQYGLWLYSNAVLNCTGTATSPNYLARFNTVQEQSNTNWQSTNWLGSVVTPGQSDSSSAYFFFTDWSVLAGDGQLYTYAYPCPVGMMSCQAYSGVFNDIGPTISSTNSLYQRVNVQMTDATVATANSFYNSLFLGGSLTVTHNNTGTWTFRDNLFDQTAITNLLSSTINVSSNNAYVTNFTTLSPEHNDVILLSSPAYQVGTLGRNYYPTSLSLIHAGSQLASAIGLYHYTVTTNNAVEGTNTVSIGFHYVATDTNGIPLDTNGDGIPDYLEDANGDGVVDNGEANWIINPYNGLTYGNGLEVFTPLH